jgi:hypothetical protein
VEAEAMFGGGCLACAAAPAGPGPEGDLGVLLSVLRGEQKEEERPSVRPARAEWDELLGRLRGELGGLPWRRGGGG